MNKILCWLVLIKVSENNQPTKTPPLRKWIRSRVFHWAITSTGTMWSPRTTRRTEGRCDCRWVVCPSVCVFFFWASNRLVMRKLFIWLVGFTHTFIFLPKNHWDLTILRSRTLMWHQLMLFEMRKTTTGSPLCSSPFWVCLRCPLMIQMFMFGFHRVEREPDFARLLG